MNMEPSAQPKVTLVGCTSQVFSPFLPESGRYAREDHNRPDPLRVIAAIWKQSKEVKPLDQVLVEVQAMSDEELSTLLVAVMEGVPVVEAVTFNFVLENVSISLREQLVRHRVGTKVDQRVGVDWEIQVIPDNADMSAWSQSMRLLDMSRFAEERRYRTPETVIALGPEAVRQWHMDMGTIEIMYARWAKQVPLEDAREFIPLGATSRLSWAVNLRTLQHICAKRGCTILQLGVWGPIILGAVSELVKKVHPAFGTLVTPPCMKGDKYTGCIFPEDIRRRFEGEDGHLPVCPLYIGRETTEQAARIQHAWRKAHAPEIDNGSPVAFPNQAAVEAEATRREVFWGRDPWTGERR
jgi:thymidylate synthase ThyX